MAWPDEKGAGSNKAASPGREVAEEVGGKGMGAGRGRRGSTRCAVEADFRGETRGASLAVREGVTDAAQANGSAKASVPAMPKSFLPGALQFFESGWGEGGVATAKAVRIGPEALHEFVDPGVADADKPGDAVGRPSGRRRQPPLPDELLDDAGFETAAPGERGAAARGASFLNVDEARVASARRFVTGSFAAHGGILRGNDSR